MARGRQARSPTTKPDRTAIRSNPHGAHIAPRARAGATRRLAFFGLRWRLGREGHRRWRNRQQDCTSRTSYSIGSAVSPAAVPASAALGMALTGTPTGARALNCDRDISARSALLISHPPSSPAPKRVFSMPTSAHSDAVKTTSAGQQTHRASSESRQRPSATMIAIKPRIH
jgi:hypothetical protein